MATIKLFESWLQSQAINEFGPHGDIEMSYITQAFDSDGMYEGLRQYFGGEDNLNYEKIKSILIRNGIVFSVTPEHAAAILTNLFIGIKQTITDLTPATWINKSGDIKLMPHPEKPTEVLTTGVFTNELISDPGNPDQASKYENIALYCNNKSLSEIAYRIKYQKGGLPGGGVILEVSPEGTLTWEKPVTGFKFKLYGTKATTSAVSKEVATTTTWEVPATGKTIVKALPGTMFETGKTTLSNTKELDSAIAELQALLADKSTKIKTIQVEASASGDRKAADGKSGYPANHPAGTQYFPKTAGESGNATLAFGRADAIVSKLKGLGVPTTTKAVIQNGGDDAQYAKLTVTVEKVGKPAELFTKTELDTILSKPKQTTGLDSTRTLSAWTAITNPQGKNS
jgi:hypothetical protein